MVFLTAVLQTPFPASIQSSSFNITVSPITEWDFLRRYTKAPLMLFFWSFTFHGFKMDNLLIRCVISRGDLWYLMCFCFLFPNIGERLPHIDPLKLMGESHSWLEALYIARYDWTWIMHIDKRASNIRGEHCGRLWAMAHKRTRADVIVNNAETTDQEKLRQTRPDELWCRFTRWINAK